MQDAGDGHSGHWEHSDERHTIRWISANTRGEGRKKQTPVGLSVHVCTEKGKRACQSVIHLGDTACAGKNLILAFVGDGKRGWLTRVAAGRCRDRGFQRNVSPVRALHRCPQPPGFSDETSGGELMPPPSILAVFEAAQGP